MKISAWVVMVILQIARVPFYEMRAGENVFLLSEHTYMATEISDKSGPMPQCCMKF